MMKKTLSILVLVIVVFTKANAKEYKSIHNITLTIPDSYIVIDEYSKDEVLKNNDGLFNEELLNTLSDQVGQIPNIEFYISADALLNSKTTIMDNINILSTDLEFQNMSESELRDLCILQTAMYESIANRKVIEHECRTSNRIRGAFDTTYTKHENFIPNAMTVQYVTFLYSKTQIVITLTCHVDTCYKHYSEFDNIVSSIRKSN